MCNLFNLENFEWVQEGIRVHIRETEIGGERVFHVVFSDKRKPLIVTRMKGFEGKRWTSIPQGRQQEAEAIGKIIEEHFRGE